MFKDDIVPPTISIDGGNLELPEKTEKIESYKFFREADDGMRLDLEVIDTRGYDDDYSAEYCASKILTNIQNAFDEVFDEEQRVRRQPKFEEHRVHALLYFIEPTGLGYTIWMNTWLIDRLKQADKYIINAVANSVNVIPIIAKADSLSQAELQAFKDRIGHDLLNSKARIYNFSINSSAENLKASAENLKVSAQAS